MSRVLAVLLLAAPVSAAEWPQWRGPTRDGQVKTAAWPDALGGAALKQVWRVPDLGPSYSGPIVSEKLVFSTETIDKKTEVVTAYDRATGKPVWTARWDGAVTVPFFAAKNGSWIRATPAFDGKTLYVAGIRDLLVALDAETGKERWRVDFVAEFKAPAPTFGFVSSPLVDESAVYVQAGGAVVKVDKATGKVVWKALADGGGMLGSAFASPAFARLAGKPQVLAQTRTTLAGLDPDTGAVVWSKEIPSFRGMNILTPTIVGDDGVFTSTYGGNTRLLGVTSDGGTYAASDRWALKYEGNMTSPVVVGGYAYLLGKDRQFLCVDLKTGKEAWRSDERFGEYWSLVANGDKLLALDQKGELLLIRANPKEFEVLDRRKIADAETWAHLAVVGDEVYVRDLTGLAMFRWSGK